MAGYGYSYRGYSTYNPVAPQNTDTWSKTSSTYNPVAPQNTDTWSKTSSTYSHVAPQTTDTWSKTSYASDHVCKPVIIDAEGRKHPVVFNPKYDTGACITKTETVVQQYHSPFVRDNIGSPTKFEYEPVKDYGYGEDKWNKPSKDYGYGEDKWSKPSKDYGYGEDKWQKPSSPVHDRPQQVEEFITKVQTGVSQPNRFSPLSASHWRKTPNSTGYHGNTGYGDYSDLGNKEWNKPSPNTIRKENYGDGTEPNLITSGGWTRPSRTGWATPPDTSLSKPTNDIGAAVEYLKEAAKPTSVTSTPYSRVSVPISSVPKRDDFVETIDSREAARRYSNFNSPSYPSEQYTATIDSREAARRYKGTRV